jgi:hypothetical protein
MSMVAVQKQTIMGKVNCKLCSKEFYSQFAHILYVLYKGVNKRDLPSVCMDFVHGHHRKLKRQIFELYIDMCVLTCVPVQFDKVSVISLTTLDVQPSQNLHL